MGKSYALTLFFPLCSGVLTQRPGIYCIIKLFYWCRNFFQVVPWLPLVVLGVDSIPADNIFKVVVFSFPDEDVFDFLFFFAVNLNMIVF